MKDAAGQGVIPIRKSLLLKLILAFWVVSILGIVIVALFAGRVSRLEFTRFIRESRYQSLVDQLSGYYAAHANFNGADYLLSDAEVLQGADTREFLVVDPQGNILLSQARVIPPGIPYPDIVRFGYSINANGRVVAYLLPLRAPRSPEQTAADNITRININLLIGVVIATLIALIFGWFMARNIIRPLRDLNSAAQAVAQGDLENKVGISSSDEIGTLAASFNQMTESLKRSRDLRRQMTADIAHELRNPLTIILGNAEALSEGVLPATPETLAIIHDEARHLSRMVDDLRTLSLSESGELHLQRNPASAAEIIERCAAAFAVRAAEGEISLRAQTAPNLPALNIDVERITQVLANLLDNSLKHTPAGGAIVLAAGVSTQIVNGVEIAVQDSGSGILPEDLPYVFDRFYRGKQFPGRILDGSGLGLAISRALVEQHGGKILAESQPGQGTRISIHLPPQNG